VESDRHKSVNVWTWAALSLSTTKTTQNKNVLFTKHTTTYTIYFFEFTHPVFNAWVTGTRPISASQVAMFQASARPKRVL
jgi:hypothetical protein